MSASEANMLLPENYKKHIYFVERGHMNNEQQKINRKHLFQI